jgi:S1-C subfamily serine protease
MDTSTSTPPGPTDPSADLPVDTVAAPAANAAAAPAVDDTRTPLAEPRSARRSGRKALGVVIAASLLSASVASLGTAGLVIVATPAATATPSTPAAQAASTAAGGTTNVTVNSSDVVVNVAAKVSPAVVTITTKTTVANGPFSVPATGVGSGFVFDSRGLILTNNHVVEGAKTVTVTLTDGTDLTGTVVATDPTLDLAVVKVDGAGLTAVAIGNSSNLQVGQLVVAIGSPLGTFSDSVTSGILSATGRSITVRDDTTRQGKTLDDLLQTDAAINEGNSGGPLLDSAGNVIGINAAVAASAEGIGFAIPISQAASIMQSAQAGIA